MRYIVRPKTGEGRGSFSVVAADAHEALDFAKGMIERGVQNVEIVDESGIALDLAELERIVKESE